jgi:S-DNA-T family DNA segregation ATPase FtsK/SpoIIIE
LSRSVHPFLPESIKNALQKGFFFLKIILLFGFSSFLFASCVLYETLGPSLNCMDTAAQNTKFFSLMLNSSGDILLQTLGVSAYGLIAFIMLHTTAFALKKTMAFKKRNVGCLFISLLGLCAFFHLWTVPQSLAAMFPESMGGIIGLSVHSQLKTFLPSLEWFLFALFMVTIMSVGCFMMAMGVSLKTIWHALVDFSTWCVALFSLYAQNKGLVFKKRLQGTLSSFTEKKTLLQITHQLPNTSHKQHEEQNNNIRSYEQEHKHVYEKDNDTQEDENYDEDFSHDMDEKIPLSVKEDFDTNTESKHAPEFIKPRVKKTHYNVSLDYHFPPIALVTPPSIQKEFKRPESELNREASQLQEVLEEFGVRGEIMAIKPGPVVTMFEFKPSAGIKTARVIGLSDDISRAMSALSTRIATIPGKNVIGIELPNQKRDTVYLYDLLQSPVYADSKAKLPLILGKDIAGHPIVADLAKMPHLLVAGTTGSGKSVSINTMILSLLYKYTPDECKMIMVDPKMLELSIYDDIPHLLTPVVTDPKKAVVALKWAVREMEERYRAMARMGVRNIDGYNARIKAALDSGDVIARRVQTGFDPDTGQPVFENQTFDLKPFPYIVIVVDEMADLMLVAGKEIEATVQRLAQMARAAGLHLITATQRPSVDVITGTIKANFPTRISFMVSSKIDSRTILGEQGAEQLLGQGDMLYMATGGRVKRVHGPFCSDEQVESVVRHLKDQGQPQYVDEVTEGDEAALFDKASSDDKNDRENDLYHQAVDIVMRENKASTSFVQRHLQIGYNRAARLIEQMEKEGIISAANHVGKRNVLKKA